MRFLKSRQNLLASMLACLLTIAAPVRSEEKEKTDQPTRASIDDAAGLEADFALDRSAWEADANVELSNWLQDSQPPAITFEPQVAIPDSSSELAAIVFGSEDVSRSLLSQARRARAMSPGTDIVYGAEAKFRVATDAGSLLGKSSRTRACAAIASGVSSLPALIGSRPDRIWTRCSTRSTPA